MKNGINFFQIANLQLELSNINFYDGTIKKVKFLQSENPNITFDEVYNKILKT